MDIEVAGAIVLIVASVCIGMKRACVYVGLPLLGAMLYAGTTAPDQQTSARRGGVASPSLPSVVNPRHKQALPSVANPRHDQAAPKPLPSVANPRHDQAATPGSPPPTPAQNDKATSADPPAAASRPAELPSTANPRHPSNAKGAKPQPQPPPPADVRLVGSIRHVDYTPDGAAKRRDDFLFRAPADTFMSTTQRARVLDSMYKELVDSSVRRDPYLREKDAPDEGCRPIRTAPHHF